MSKLSDRLDKLKEVEDEVAKTVLSKDRLFWAVTYKVLHSENIRIGDCDSIIEKELSRLVP